MRPGPRERHAEEGRHRRLVEGCHRVTQLRPAPDLRRARQVPGLVHMKGVQQLVVLQRRPIAEAPRVGIPAPVDHDRRVGIHRADGGDQLRVERRQVTRRAAVLRVPGHACGRRGLLVEPGALLRRRLVEQVVASQRRVVLHGGRQVAPERGRLVPVRAVAPQALVLLVAVVLRPAVAGQRQRHQHDLHAGGLRRVQAGAQQRQVAGRQPGVAVGVADQEVAAGALPFAEGQPHPGRAAGTQRAEIGFVGRPAVEAVAAMPGRVPEGDVGCVCRSGKQPIQQCNHRGTETQRPRLD